ncbi:MAG: response regulator transcription factor [Proteobacteria bacterium]|nr:response regulator transcription factor [Pseudomonadota bacterium]
MGLVLTIEDEADLARKLQDHLNREGFAARVASTGVRGIELTLGSPVPDLVLLGLRLPDIPGIEVCRRIRQEPATHNVPIIVLAPRGDEVDRILGFEVGADDYVVRPFSMRELMLRVRAVLRRGSAPVKGLGQLRADGLRLDPASHRVWVDGEEIVLTALEFRLLRTLLSHKEQVQTRKQLLQEVWHVPGEMATRTVDTHMNRLRQKLGKSGTHIETLRGVGYRFCGARGVGGGAAR